MISKSSFIIKIVSAISRAKFITKEVFIISRAMFIAEIVSITSQAIFVLVSPRCKLDTKRLILLLNMLKIVISNK